MFSLQKFIFIFDLQNINKYLKITLTSKAKVKVYSILCYSNLNIIFKKILNTFYLLKRIKSKLLDTRKYFIKFFILAFFFFKNDFYNIIYSNKIKRII